MNKQLLTTLLTTTLAINVSAQALLRRVNAATTRSGQSLTERFSHLAAKDLPPMHVTPGGALLNSAISRQIATQQTALVLPTDPTHATAATGRADQRSWLVQQQRNYQAWKLKRLHARQIALPHLRPQEAFHTADFKAFIADTAIIPALPFTQRPDYLYRGLGLQEDGAALANILQNGLRVEDAGNYSDKLLLSLAITPEDASLISAHKYTNLTSSPQMALRYALKNKRRCAKNVLPVIVAVQGEAEYTTVVRVQHDIAPTHIPYVIALLQINGTSTWCRIEQAQDGFLVTPYEVK